jgi:hypothetical protein
VYAHWATAKIIQGLPKLGKRQILYNGTAFLSNPARGFRRFSYGIISLKGQLGAQGDEMPKEAMGNDGNRAGQAFYLLAACP